jgi:two-component system response regulator MprA
LRRRAGDARGAQVVAALERTPPHDFSQIHCGTCLAKCAGMTQATKTGRPLLLIVDDDARSARLLAKLLREDGFDVDVAFDGGSALSRLGDAPTPDALIVDLHMPHVDGWTVASYARSRRAAIPILIVTAYPELLRGLHGLEPHPTVFSKPLEYAELKTALDHLERAA